MMLSNTCESSPSYPCSGHGVCVNVSSTLSACLCDASEWTGGNDMFDMRISQMLPGGERLALDCTQSSVGVIVSWSFFLLLVLVRAAQNVRALVEQCERKRPSRWQDIVKEMRFRALVGDLLTTVPLASAAAIMKIATARSNDVVVIGSDPAFTVLFVVSIWCGLGTVVDFLHIQFATLVRSQIDLKQNRKKLYAASSWLNILTFASYGVLNALPTMVALGLDKSLGPWDNNEYIIIIVRNLGVILWQVFQLWGSRHLSGQIQAIRHFASLQHHTDTNDSSSPSHKNQSIRASGQQESVPPARLATQGSSTALNLPASQQPASPSATDGKLEAIIEMMDERRRDLLKTNVVVFLAYSTFTIPFFYPYQTYCLTVLAALGMLTNPGRALHSIYSASKAAGTLSKVSSKQQIPATRENTNSKGSRTTGTAGMTRNAGGGVAPSSLSPGSVTIVPHVSAVEGEEMS